MRIFKLFFIAGISVLLADCTNNDQQETFPVVKTPETNFDSRIVRAANDVTQLRGIISTSGSEGWMADDSIQTYTLRSTKHNTYRLTQGEGGMSALFSRINGTDSYDDGGTVYALTSCKYIYGVSATTNKMAKVSITIPNSYPYDEVAAPDGLLRKPVPYWGIADFASDGKLEASMKGLTALLKLDVASLPDQTRAIILTTHSYADVEDISHEGGGEEPLAGTFNAVLSDGAQLIGNPIFYSYDSLRVNIDIDAEKYKNLFIPVVANTYNALHVIAVTGDDRFPYSWNGKVLKTFKASTSFKPNTIVSLEPESTGIKSPVI